MTEEVTLYPFGQNNPVPAGYPIADDLSTDSAQYALSAKQGKKLADFIFPREAFDASVYAETEAYIQASSGKWRSNDASYTCRFIPVLPNEKYYLQANGNGTAYYAVLTSDAHTNSSGASFATGYTLPATLAAGESASVPIPANGAYLYIAVKVNGQNREPSISKHRTTEFVDEYIANNFNGGTEKALSAEMGKVLNENTRGYSLIEISSVQKFITYPGNKWFVGQAAYQAAIIPVNAGETYEIVGQSNKQCRYAVLTSDSAVTDETPSYATGYAFAVAIAGGESATITIPEDGLFLYISTKTNEAGDISPAEVRKYISGGVLDKVRGMIQDYADQSIRFPSLLVMGDPTNVIYTIDDFILAHEYVEGSVDNLKFSTDLGKTWITVTNTFGVITNAFRFADGTFMMCCQQSDGMHFLWSRDFETFNDCVVYDYNGEPYQTRTGDRRCFINRPRYQHLYVNNTEYYLIGDYVFPDSNPASANPRLWYAISEDAGVTMRCAFAFGLQQIDGVTIPARHVHNFEYNKYNGYFYAMTGDHGSEECNIMRGKHDTNHVWTWERIAHGQEYKVMYPVFDEGNIYLTTDYTDSSLADKKGIVSAPINRISFNNFHYLFHATESFMREGGFGGAVAALAQIVIDNHGWKFMITDYIGNSKNLIAKDDHNFVWVDNTSNKHFNGLIGPNNKGEMYVSFKEPGGAWPETGLKISHKKTYNLTEAMRNSGASNFFLDYSTTPY